MTSPPQDPYDREYDPDSTDTLPLPVLIEEDTGRLAALDPAAGSHASTDAFHPAALTPMAARPVAASDLAETLREQEQQLQRANEKLQQADQRLAELTARLAAASNQPPAPVPVPVAVPVSQDGETASLRRQNARLHEALTSMHARIGVQEALLAEAEEALRAAPAAAPAAPPAAPPATTAAVPPPAAAEHDHALRIDWQARFHELETVLEAERNAAATRSREQADRLAAMQAELETLRSQSARHGVAVQSLPIGTTLRVLVREEEGTELVYPLGRHTRIGRTPDNDIQVNTTFVSRHHAVLLTSSEHCIVEDLNSTNGIIVNGQRVGRQLLQDGDVLTIGKTHFRYETRP